MLTHRRSNLYPLAGILLANAAIAQRPDNNLEAALTRAKEANRDILVFVTGSDWNVGSDYLVKKALADRKLLDGLGKDYELVHIDLTLNGQSTTAVKDRETALATLRKLAIWRHDQFPCAVFVSPDGLPRLRTALPQQPTDKLLDLLRDHGTAVAATRKPATHPERAQAHVVEAMSLLQEGKAMEAAAAAQEAIKDDPCHVGAWDTLAAARARLSKGSEIEAARQAIALSPLDKTADGRTRSMAAIRWARLALAYEAKKRDEEAIFCYRQAMAVDRSHFEAGLRSAQLCIKRKDYAGACRDANEVLRRDLANEAALEIRTKYLPANYR